MPVVLQEQPVYITTVSEEEKAFSLREEVIPVSLYEETFNFSLREEKVNVQILTEVIQVQVTCVCLPETGLERYEKQLLEGEFSSGKTSVFYFSMPPGKKLEFVFVNVKQAFRAGSHLTLGTASDETLILLPDETALDYPGQYQKSVNLSIPAGVELYLYLTLPPGSSQNGLVEVTALLE